VSDYPELDDLCAALEKLAPNLRLSTSSVRLESATPRFLRLLARGGQRTVTFAPEAATERLRQAIGKHLPEQEILAAVERAAAAGLTRVRLYFMVGLPTETEEDRAGLTTLRNASPGSFRSCISAEHRAFSPRPHTPFEMQALPAQRDLRNRLTAGQHSLRALPRVEVATESARWRRCRPSCRDRMPGPERRWPASRRRVQRPTGGPGGRGARFRAAHGRPR